MVVKSEHLVNDLLLEIADKKRLPVDFLLRFARPRDDGSIVIRYGADYRPRYRAAAAAKHGSLWATNGQLGQRPIGPYGPGLGTYNADWRIIAEGESDCWALWFHDFPAVGVPGASMAHVLAADHFAGVSRVYIHREPDAAGEAFVAAVAKRLRAIGYTGEILRFGCGGHKDPADLHAAVADDGQGGFRDEMESLLEAAVPAAEPVLGQGQQTGASKARGHQHGVGCGCGGKHAGHSHGTKGGGKLDMEAIRQQLELVDLRAVISRDIGPQQKGGKWFCPFHSDENTPNLSVSPDGRRYNCWACGAKGDAIDWLRERHGLSFVAAAQELGLQVPADAWFADEADYEPEWREKTADEKRWDEILDAAFGGGCPELSIDGGTNTDNSGHGSSPPPEPIELPEFSVSSCRRNGGVVQEARANTTGTVFAAGAGGQGDAKAVPTSEGSYRVIYAPCRCRNCLGCGPVWEKRRTKWFSHCLNSEGNPLLVLECSRSDWGTVRKRIVRHSLEGGPRYLAVETEPNRLLVLTTSPVIDAEPITKADAVNLMTDAIYAARPVKTPVMQCKAWRLPSKEQKAADAEWQTVARFRGVSRQQKRDVAAMLAAAKVRTAEIFAADDSHEQLHWQLPARCHPLQEAALLGDVLDLLGVKEPPPDDESDDDADDGGGGGF